MLLNTVVGQKMLYTHLGYLSSPRNIRLLRAGSTPLRGAIDVDKSDYVFTVVVSVVVVLVVRGS